MFPKIFQKFTNGAAGLSALGTGLAITIAPRGFYAGYGIELGPDPTLLSELRAPGACLAALGAMIIAGAWRPGMARLSATLGAVAFMAFAFGRLVSMAVDGMPARGIVAACLVEAIIGALCLLSLREQETALTPRPGANW